MISAIESQRAGSCIDQVKQPEEIFSPTGFLSRGKNSSIDRNRSNDTVTYTHHPDRPAHATPRVHQPKENLSHGRNHSGHFVVILRMSENGTRLEQLVRHRLRSVKPSPVA